MEAEAVTTQSIEKKGESKFDGSRLEYFGISVIALLLTVCTLGLLYPYATVMKMNWDVKHTVIDGRRLYFTGTGAGFFGTWIKIWLLGIITLSIYLWFASGRIKKWKVSHMHFE